MTELQEAVETAIFYADTVMEKFHLHLERATWRGYFAPRLRELAETQRSDVKTNGPDEKQDGGVAVPSKGGSE